MSSYPPPVNEPSGYANPELDVASNKRPRSENEDGGLIPTKKVKATPEEPALYSESVRKKLASTSRTGQACDRCKERKMKCDPDPIACQPCRQKNLRCYTTDRVSGQSRERGATDRVENEIHYLREQVAAYQQKYGSLKAETPYPSHAELTTPSQERQQRSSLGHTEQQMQSSSFANLPDPRYTGWPAPDAIEALRQGPVDGTVVNILDAGSLDIADFDCEIMHDYPINEFGHFNCSKNSVTNTMALRQRIDDARLPSKEQALSEVQTFLALMYQFFPVVHKQSFIDVTTRLYDDPASISISESVQVIIVLAILAQQTGVRNHSQAAEKFEQSNRYLHYALGYYQELYRDRSLASMQAMLLILLHFRNLPKPGYTWALCHNTIIRAIDMEYHRDPEKIQLPPEDQNPLAKELRKRIFHTVLTMCITTSCRVGRPVPLQFTHVDVPLPMAIKDSEISKESIVSPRSGQCDFWPFLQLCKLVPLLAELYNYVISVRRPEAEYLKIVDILKTKIDAWRADWDSSISAENPDNTFLTISTYLMDTWASEYLLNLYHPSVCTSKSPEVIDRNLDVCHKAARKLLGAFHILSARYKGVDFTWHSTVAYALGFGATLHIYRRRKSTLTIDQFEAMKNELNGWLSLMAYADLVLRTGNHLQRSFQPHVQKLEEDYRALIPNPPASAPPSRASFSHVNGSQARTPIKTEASPQSSSFSGIPAPQRPGIVWEHHQAPQSMSHPSHTPTFPYVNHTNHPSTTFVAYSPTVPQYPALPTSLAPLLNETPPNGYVAQHTPVTPSQQEIPMMFTPTHYTDHTPSFMWPAMYEG